MSEPFQHVPPPSGPSGPRAGFWSRLAALVIDYVVVFLAGGVIVVIGYALDVGVVIEVGLVTWVFGWIAYDIYFQGRPAGQTVGKRLLGIRVIDFATGGPIGYGRSAIRTLGQIISGWFCYLGYLWMLWDREKQCWHDKMANDVVVPTEYYPVPRWP